jgi:hypothetical protein
MQWLTLVPENTGIQRLRTERPVTASTRRLDAAAPYPSAHAAQIGDPRADSRPPRRERRRTERRHHERRGQQLPVAFDTRSKHDRRGCQDRRAPRDVSTATPRVTGIDVYA